MQIWHLLKFGAGLLILMTGLNAYAVGFRVNNPGDKVAKINIHSGNLEYNPYIYKVVDIVRRIGNLTQNQCTGLWLGDKIVLTHANCTNGIAARDLSVNFYIKDELPIKFYGIEAYNGLWATYGDIINLVNDSRIKISGQEYSENNPVDFIGRMDNVAGFVFLHLSREPAFKKSGLYNHHKADFSDPLLPQNKFNFSTLLAEDASINGNASSNMVLNPVLIDVLDSTPNTNRNRNKVSYSLNFYGYGFDNQYQDTSKAFELLGNDNTYSISNSDNSHDNSITFSRLFVNTEGMRIASFICGSTFPDTEDLGAPVFIKNNLTKQTKFIGIIDNVAITNQQYILNVLLVDNIP